jgi:hypothetical protein
MTKITYGRKKIGNKIASFVEYTDGQGDEIEIIHYPYEDLIVKRNNKKIDCKPEHAMLWTHVSGKIAMNDFCSKL